MFMFVFFNNIFQFLIHKVKDLHKIFQSKCPGEAILNVRGKFVKVSLSANIVLLIFSFLFSTFVELLLIEGLAYANNDTKVNELITISPSL